jgi:ABC-type nickel/cobalt efflux system permease component RcnA
MSYGPELLLVAAVATVGVLHTIVPDHWLPITLIARQRGWSKFETARAALQAGIGHVLSTLLIALVVWLAGVAFAQRFGHIVDTVSSLALIAFGGWFAISAWRDLRRHGGHGHSHSHGFPHLHGDDHGAHPGSFHGPELQRIATEDGVLELSIFETGVPPRFRLSGVAADTVRVQTCREGNERQDFSFANRWTYWESIEQIPEPHEFAVSLIINHGGHAHVTRPNLPSTTMVTMSTATITGMGTTMKRRRRMIHFMHPCAVKRVSSRGMFTRTGTGGVLSIRTGTITRQVRPIQ